MDIKIKNKKYNLAFTFNSFKHMTDFDASVFESVQDKPFMMVAILSDLFYGAMNHNRKNHFDRDECDELLETYLDGEDADMGEFAEQLITMLTNTSFFKQRQ